MSKKHYQTADFATQAAIKALRTEYGSGPENLHL